MGKKKTFIAYIDWVDYFDEDTTMEQKGQIFDAILRYQNGDEDVKPVDPAARMVFNKIRKTMQADAEAYEEQCAKNAESARKRWHANAYDRIRTNTDTDTDTETKTDTESSKEDGIASDAFLLADGSAFVLPPERISDFEKTFPEVNVKAELMCCRLKHNALSKRRTAVSIEQYIVNWMLNAQGDAKKTTTKASFTDMQKHEDTLGDKFWKELASKPGNLI